MVSLSNNVACVRNGSTVRKISALQTQTTCFHFASVTNLLKDIANFGNRGHGKKKSSITLMTFSFSCFSSASYFSQPWTSVRNTRKHFHSTNVSCDWVPHTSRDVEKIIQSVTPGEGEIQQQRAANFTSSQRRLGHVHLLSKKPFRKS